MDKDTDRDMDNWTPGTGMDIWHENGDGNGHWQTTVGNARRKHIITFKNYFAKTNCAKYKILN